MPIYEYQCTECGHELEKLQKLNDPPLTDCPACGKATLQKRVSAVVSVSGAVGGSPLANTVTQSVLNLLQYFPDAECDPGDEGALESLRPEVRKRWLATHSLPESIRYYSIITYPDADHISSMLKSSYEKLSQVDSRNDSQMIFYDQLIPGSVLLGYVNADHWAVAVPVAPDVAVAVRVESCTVRVRVGSQVLVGVRVAVKNGVGVQVGTKVLVGLGSGVGVNVAVKVGSGVRVGGIWAIGEVNGRGAFTHTSYNDYEIVAANPGIDPWLPGEGTPIVLPTQRARWWPWAISRPRPAAWWPPLPESTFRATRPSSVKTRSPTRPASTSTACWRRRRPTRS